MASIFFRNAVPKRLAHAPVEGPALRHILAVPTGLRGLKKQTHTIGRVQWWVIWQELEWSEWGLSWLKIYYIRISNSQIVKHNTNIGALTPLAQNIIILKIRSSKRMMFNMSILELTFFFFFWDRVPLFSSSISETHFVDETRPYTHRDMFACASWMLGFHLTWQSRLLNSRLYSSVISSLIRS